MRDRGSRGGVRWRTLLWPAGVTLGLATAGLAWIWLRPSAQRQDQVVPTLIVAGVAGGLVVLWLAIWLAALSGLSRARRVSAVAALAVVLGGLASALRVQGVTGDIVPVVTWRFVQDPPLAQAGPRPGAPDAVADWSYPQFLGAGRDGRARGPALGRDWIASPPRLLWRRPVGAGWSAFAVAAGLAVTQEQLGDDEVIRAYDLLTGEPRWSHAVRARFLDPIGGPGPRATPSIAGGRVLALGATGVLTALDLATGAPLWSRDLAQERGMVPPTYGFSASPLVLGDLVVIALGAPGAALCAFDAATGREVWAGGDGPPAYGSPRLAALAGREQILVLNGEAVAAHDPSDGRVLWTHPWPGETQRAFTPLPLEGDRVFVSTGYGSGGKLFRVRRAADGALAADVLWESQALRAKFTNVVEHEGFLYGLDDGILVCLDPHDGTRRWKQGRYGHGQVLLAGDLLLVTLETGGVALVAARSDAFVELGRAAPLTGKTWNAPALAGPFLLVRNDRQAACLELPLASGAGAGDV